MRPSKVYPFSVPAFGSVNLPVTGDFFKIKSATGSMTVIGNTFGALANLLPGQGLRDTEFGSLVLVDETGAINNGYLLVSDSTFVDDRVTGEVSIIDGGKARSYASQAFFANVFCGAVAAQLSHCQLWNPPGSGKNLIVEQYYVSSGSASAIGIGLYNAQLSTAAGNPLSKNNGVGAGVASQWSQNNAAALASGSAAQVYVNAAQTSPLIKFTEPLIVKPGNGIFAVNQTANATLGLCLEFFEEVIP